MRAGFVYHTWWRVTVLQSLSERSAATSLHWQSPIVPHSSYASWSNQSTDARENQIFISDLFIFKSCFLKVTKEQNCLWQAHYNDSVTYCVRQEQLWSSSIILRVKTCVFVIVVCRVRENLHEQLDYLTKIIVLPFTRNTPSAKMWNKYKRSLWFSQIFHIQIRLICRKGG